MVCSRVLPTWRMVGVGVPLPTVTSDLSHASLPPTLAHPNPSPSIMCLRTQRAVSGWSLPLKGWWLCGVMLLYPPREVSRAIVLRMCLDVIAWYCGGLLVLWTSCELPVMFSKRMGILEEQDSVVLAPPFPPSFEYITSPTQCVMHVLTHLVSVLSNRLMRWCDYTIVTSYTWRSPRSLIG